MKKKCQWPNTDYRKYTVLDLSTHICISTRIAPMFSETPVELYSAHGQKLKGLRLDSKTR